MTATFSSVSRLNAVDVQILERLARGDSNTTIGMALYLSPAGLEYRVTRLNKLFRASNRASLVARTYHLGVLAGSPPKVTPEWRAEPAPDVLDRMLGIDTADPTQNLAAQLVQADDELMRDLLAARYSAGVTPEQVAERMAVPVGSVRALERVGADPCLSTVRRYALAVGALVQHTVTPATVDEGSTNGD